MAVVSGLVVFTNVILLIIISILDIISTTSTTIQVLDSYKLNPEKFKWLDIDIRSDMDAIQNQMKQVEN